MTLVLRGMTLNEQPISRPLIGRFDERGGTVGRSDDSTFTLPDPERLISRQQAQVVHTGQHFWLENLSAVSVILHNGRPLSTGMRVVLRNGDELKVGGYTLQASFEEDADNATILLGRTAVAPAQPPRPAVPKLRAVRTDILPSTMTEPLDRTFLLALRQAPEPGPKTAEREPEPQKPAVTQPRALEPEALEPEALEPVLAEPPAPQVIEAAPPPAVAEPPASVIQAPQAVAAPVQPIEPEPEVRASAAKVRKSKPAARKAKPAEVRKPASKPKAEEAESLWHSFLHGAGIEPSSQQVPSNDLMSSVGEMLRIAVGGIQRLITLRAKAKNEMRAEMTMLQVRDNNPLKFSRDTNAALQMLLQPPARGFLAGPEALRAAVSDLQAHQAGMRAGTRAALAAALDRLDPAKLGPPRRRRSLLSILRPGRKAALWDRYVKQYESLREDVQQDFDRFFGEVFREAYAAQAQKPGAALDAERASGDWGSKRPQAPLAK
jgi:FHA domain-containing protein